MIKLARAQVTVSNREEAIQVVGNLLKENHYIQQDYINACQKVLSDYGAYFVIAPQIAFVHSKPDSSILKTGLSLITLNPPIKFGSMDNDPVSIVFMIASVNGDDHLNMLKKLSRYLADKQKIKELIAITSDNTLSLIVNQFNEEVS